mmetsp:Transcript_21503/g.28282  ORF Transcript_21503/g.28282 Transcript_21503/m.28282 type:complete len:88 (-) Transcript_21503:66-329(-)
MVFDDDMGMSLTISAAVSRRKDGSSVGTDGRYPLQQHGTDVKSLSSPIPWSPPGTAKHVSSAIMGSVFPNGHTNTKQFSSAFSLHPV